MIRTAFKAWDAASSFIPCPVTVFFYYFSIYLYFIVDAVFLEAVSTSALLLGNTRHLFSSSSSIAD